VGALQPWHIIILVVVLIALFGARKLPDAAKGIGHSLRIFKAEAKAMKDEGKDAYDGKDGAEGNQGQHVADGSAAGQLEAPAQPQQPQHQPQYQPQQQAQQPQYPQAPASPAQHTSSQSVSGTLGDYPPAGYDNPADYTSTNGHGATHAQR
jgi:sec-independent protein translocase protein TatA